MIQFMVSSEFETKCLTEPIYRLCIGSIKVFCTGAKYVTILKGVEVLVAIPTVYEKVFVVHG